MAGLSGKRWMVSLTAEQYEWVKETAESTKLKGSEVLRAIVDRVMQEKAGTFRKELATEHLRIELQKLNDAQAEIEERRQLLTKQMKGEREKVMA